MNPYINPGFILTRNNNLIIRMDNYRVLAPSFGTAFGGRISSVDYVLPVDNIHQLYGYQDDVLQNAISDFVMTTAFPGIRMVDVHNLDIIIVHEIMDRLNQRFQFMSIPLRRNSLEIGCRLIRDCGGDSLHIDLNNIPILEVERETLTPMIRRLFLSSDQYLRFYDIVETAPYLSKIGLWTANDLDQDVVLIRVLTRELLPRNCYMTIEFITHTDLLETLNRMLVMTTDTGSFVRVQTGGEYDVEFKQSFDKVLLRFVRRMAFRKEDVAVIPEHVFQVNHVTFENSSIANDCGDVTDCMSKMEITQETDTNESSVIKDFNKHFMEISPTKPIASPSTPNSKKRPRRGRKSKNLNSSTLKDNQDSETTTTPSTSSELVLENGATEKDFEIPVVDIEIDDEAAFKYPRSSIFAVRDTVDEPSESQVKYFKQYGIYQPSKKDEQENEEESVQQDEIESFVDELAEKKSVGVEGECYVPPDFVLPELPAEPVFVPEVPSAEVSKDGDEEAEQLKTAMETREICFEEFFVVLPDIDEVKKQLHQVPTWQDDDFCYTFRDGNCFNHGCSPEVKCSFCEKITHVSEFCPQMVIPKCKPVTHEITPMEMEELKLAIDYNYESNKVKPERRKRIIHFISHVESILRIKLSDPSINLCVFGSVTNGFGNDRSDADVCLRFNTEEPPENVSAVKVIEEVFRVLRDLPRKHDIDHVQAITSAKVPIVKFFHRGSLRLEVDISYYNTLALYNTQLLYTYTQWAPKIVPQLGLFVKRWAKECEIGDASKGSLSSYSYIVMLINYLQSCDPPVLPRLQEDVINGIDPQEHPTIIDGWNVSFYSGKPIQNRLKNKKNVAEHFLSFLDFYAHFDFSSLVIQIRRKAQMPKIEKDWRKPICLEDPFDLNHNLGAGVSTRMAVHIQKCFVKSRDVFFSLEPRKTFTKGEDVEIVGRAIDLYKDYLLHACVFARPPIDRQCRHCFKVGHQADGCPLKYKKLKPRGGKPNR